VLLTRFAASDRTHTSDLSSGIQPEFHSGGTMTRTSKGMYVTVKAGVRRSHFVVVINRQFEADSLMATLAEQLDGSSHSAITDEAGRTVIRMVITDQGGRLCTSKLRDVIMALADTAKVRPKNVTVELEGRVAPMLLTELCDLLKRAGGDFKPAVRMPSPRRRPLIYPHARPRTGAIAKMEIAS